jgi:hypothetical protein
MSLNPYKMPSLIDKHRELSNEDLQEEVDKFKSNGEEDNKVEKPKVKKEKKK